MCSFVGKKDMTTRWTFKTVILLQNILNFTQNFYMLKMRNYEFNKLK